MVERASQPSPTITLVRSGAALDRETLPPLASVTPMFWSLPGMVPVVVVRSPSGAPSGAARTDTRRRTVVRREGAGARAQTLTPKSCAMPRRPEA
ncbi:hypothetical protein GCM10018787_20960 [Streptomyces thermodiastaticus]|nr:hypothetical protein GCM10018787_20960 [Streptomyces thermodiastaticus]